MPPAEGKDVHGKGVAGVPAPQSPAAYPEEEDAPFVYDAAGPTRCLMALGLQALLDAKPEALQTPDAKGNYLLHTAAASKAADCVALLVDRHVAVDRHFDPRLLLNARGESPLHVAEGHPPCLQALAVWRPAAAPPRVLWPQRSKSDALLFDLSPSHLVDNQPFLRSEVTLSNIIAGMLQAEAAFLAQHPKYADWLLKRNALADGVFWRSHTPVLTMAQQLTAVWYAGEEAVFGEAISVFAPESFLHQAIPTAQPDSEVGRHLAPFLKLLLCALQSSPLQNRHRQTSFCTVSLADAQQMCRPSHPADPLVDHFRFDNMTMAVTSPQAVADLLVRYGRKALVVITPANPNDPNCCPVVLPGDELEVVFPAIQQYRVRASGYMPGKELAARLGVPVVMKENFFVIEMEAVDVFWEMAQEMMKSEKQAVALSPVLEARVRFDLDMYGPRHPKVVTGLLCVARDLQRRGELRDAALMFQRAVEAQSAVIGAHHADVGVTYGQLAGVYEGLGEWDRALAMYERSLELQLAVWGPMELEMGRMCHRMATLYQKQGNQVRALELYAKSRAVKEAVLGPRDPVVGAISFVMAQLFQAEGQYPQALEAYNRVLAIQSAPPGPVYLRMAEVYSAMGSHTDAIDMYRKVIRMQVEEWGANSLVVGETYARMAQAYTLSEDTESALAACSTALDIRLLSLGERHDEVVGTYEQMGKLWKTHGDAQMAVKAFEKAIQIMTRIQPALPRLQQQMAVVCSVLGDYRLVHDMYQKALEALRRELGARHPDVQKVQAAVLQSQKEMLTVLEGEPPQRCVIQ
eukprot:EG_transcript_1598